MSQNRMEEKIGQHPHKNHPAIYVLYNCLMEGRPGVKANYSLEGQQITGQIMNLMPCLDIGIAEDLQNGKAFQRLVHSIGVRMTADGENNKKTAEFSLRIRTGNKVRDYWYQTDVSLDGKEAVIIIPEEGILEEDTFLVSFQAGFPTYMTASVTACFYLRLPLAVPQISAGRPVDFQSAAYRRLLAGSLMTAGNTSRLKRTIKKARAGEEVTLAYIGGSITQGAGAKPVNTMCYAYRSYEAFCRRFAPGGGENIHFIKAGVSGTPSQLGIARYEAEVLHYGIRKPDVVIIEFAVNDDDDETAGDCFESLALMAYEGPGAPAVVLLFSVLMDDSNLQERLARVGAHYGFPMVSIKNAVVPQFYQEDPVITKQQYFYDIFHPSNEGHRLMGDALDYLWQAADEAKGPTESNLSNESSTSNQLGDALPAKPVIGSTYKSLRVFSRHNSKTHPAIITLEPGGFLDTDEDLQMVERDDQPFATPQFPHNWMFAGKNNSDISNRNSGFRMTITCKDLMLIYKDSDDPAFGPADIYVDGCLQRTIDPLAVGWTHCNAVNIINSDRAALHQVEIRPLDPGCRRQFTILGFGYTLA